jgi:hypothetical protein
VKNLRRFSQKLLRGSPQRGLIFDKGKGFFTKTRSPSDLDCEFISEKPEVVFTKYTERACEARVDF